MTQNQPSLIQLGEHARVLVLMATTIEYLDHLRELVKPEIIGVGPVEAALGTVQALAQCEPKPTHIVLLGSSGAAQLEQGAVYQASSVAYRDMDASAIGFAKGLTPFLDQPAHMPLKPQFERLSKASLSTGASIVAGAQFDEIDAQMVDMESYAVARVAQNAKVPLIVLRGISDGVKHLRKYEDWMQLLPLVDENLAKATQIVFDELAQST